MNNELYSIVPAPVLFTLGSGAIINSNNDLYGPPGLRPLTPINYVCATEVFTISDMTKTKLQINHDNLYVMRCMGIMG